MIGPHTRCPHCRQYPAWAAGLNRNGADLHVKLRCIHFRRRDAETMAITNTTRMTINNHAGFNAIEFMGSLPSRSIIVAPIDWAIITLLHLSNDIMTEQFDRVLRPLSKSHESLARSTTHAA